MSPCTRAREKNSFTQTSFLGNFPTWEVPALLVIALSGTARTLLLPAIDRTGNGGARRAGPTPCLLLDVRVWEASLGRPYDQGEPDGLPFTFLFAPSRKP